MTPHLEPRLARPIVPFAPGDRLPGLHIVPHLQPLIVIVLEEAFDIRFLLVFVNRLLVFVVIRDRGRHELATLVELSGTGHGEVLLSRHRRLLLIAGDRLPLSQPPGQEQRETEKGQTGCPGDGRPDRGKHGLDLDQVPAVDADEAGPP